jgi:hypothetical protein
MATLLTQFAPEGRQHLVTTGQVLLLKHVSLSGDAPDESGNARRVCLRARGEKDIALRGQIVCSLLTR